MICERIDCYYYNSSMEMNCCLGTSGSDAFMCLSRDYRKFVKNNIPDDILYNSSSSRDRNCLEWLVFYCLCQPEPQISIGRGRELLGFKDMQKMREWMDVMRTPTKEGGE